MITAFVSFLGFIMGIVAIILLEVLDTGRVRFPLMDYIMKYKIYGFAAIAVLTGIFNFLYIKFNLSWFFLRYDILFLILVVAALYDLKYKLIPNLLIYIGLPLGVLLSAVEFSLEAVFNSIIAIAVGGGIIMVLHFITKGGVGKGDALLFSCAGAYMGLTGVINAMIIAALISGMFGVIMIIIKKYTRKSYMPFAPFILAGCVITILNI